VSTKLRQKHICPSLSHEAQKRSSSRTPLILNLSGKPHAPDALASVQGSGAQSLVGLGGRRNGPEFNGEKKNVLFLPNKFPGLSRSSQVTVRI
jgi:hypothetical protein